MFVIYLQNTRFVEINKKKTVLAAEVFCFVVDGAESGINSQDWQRCRALAQVISRCPLTASNTEKFYRLVCQQVGQLYYLSTQLILLISHLLYYFIS